MLDSTNSASEKEHMWQWTAGPVWIPACRNVGTIRCLGRADVVCRFYRSSNLRLRACATVPRCASKQRIVVLVRSVCILVISNFVCQCLEAFSPDHSPTDMNSITSAVMPVKLASSQTAVTSLNRHVSTQRLSFCLSFYSKHHTVI